MSGLYDEIKNNPELGTKVVEVKPKRSTPGYMREFIENPGTNLVINPDLKRASYRQEYEKMRLRLALDFNDALMYSLQGLIEAFKNVGYSAIELQGKLDNSRRIFLDELDTSPSTGYLLKEKIKLTRGKARRKIRRQIRNWKKQKFLLSQKEIEECQKMINLK